MALIPCNPLKVPAAEAYKACTIGHLGGLLVGIFEFLLGLSVVIALMMIVWGGFQMVKGWFEEDPAGAYKDGKNTVRRAVFGLVLVLGAYLIVETLLFLFTGKSNAINFFFNQAFG